MSSSSIDCSILWQSDPIEELLWWHFAIGRLGGPNVAKDRPVLLCIRGVRPLAVQTHDLRHVPEYDDTAVLIVLGEPTVIFPLATHAYQARSRLSPDVNRDGQGDVGSVRPGRYVLHDLRNGREVIFHVKMPDGSPRLPCWRDFNGDRFLSPEEIAQSEAARTGAQVGDDGTWADSILLHGGLDSPADHKHKYSIGCFTASLGWRELLAEKAKAGGGKIDMLLVNATDLVALAEERKRTFSATPELSDPLDEESTVAEPRRS